MPAATRFFKPSRSASASWSREIVLGLVAFGGVAAVLLYRYVDVGAIGPLPDMYDASWYSEKTWSAIAEAAAAGAAFWLFFLEPRRRSVTPPAASS